MGEKADVIALAVLIDRLAAEHRARAMEAAAEEGLPENLAEALWLLGGSETSPSMRELAAELRCDPSNATIVIGQLEGRGLVTRTADVSDRRRRVVSVTDAGSRVLARMTSEVDAASPLRRLSADHRAALTAALAVARADD